MVPPENAEEGAKVADVAPTPQLLAELVVVSGRQTELIAQLRAQYVGEGSAIAEENARLRAQLAEAQAEAESAKAYAKKIA